MSNDPEKYTVFGATRDGCAPTLSWNVPYELIRAHGAARQRIEDLVSGVPLPRVAELLAEASSAHAAANYRSLRKISDQLAIAEWGKPLSTWVRLRLRAEVQEYAALGYVASNLSSPSFTLGRAPKPPKFRSGTDAALKDQVPSAREITLD